MTMSFLCIPLSVSLTLGGIPDGLAREPVRPMNDPVQRTMTTMRLIGTQIEDLHRNTGILPAADGELRTVRVVLSMGPVATESHAEYSDGWGRPVRYRANAQSYELISYGGDGRPDRDYASQRLFPGRFSEILEATTASADLVLVDGRFTQRPFGSRTAAFETINGINRLFMASASFAVDNNRYPGSTTGFVPVSELAADLVPVYMQDLPTHDGWGRPLLYFASASSFVLASFGVDGQPDRTYYPDLACGMPLNEEGPSRTEGGDVMQFCGRFAFWPKGTEP